jgi:hypothetical protein
MTEKKSKDTDTSTTKQIDRNDMFLKRALEKLLLEKDIKKSQHQQLKRACETALSSVTKDIETSQ